MGALNHAARFLIKTHFYLLIVVVLCQYSVGAFTEWLADITGWTVKQIVPWHKFVGQGLCLAAFTMFCVKMYVLAAGLVRSPIANSGVRFFIRNHWMVLTPLFMAQYATTIEAKWTAGLLGWEPKDVFALHGPIAGVIALDSILLFILGGFLDSGKQSAPDAARAAAAGAGKRD